MSDHDYAYRVEVGPRKGPSPASEVYIGLAGEIVEALDPTTEADPVASLACLLAVFSALVGPGPHMMLSNDRHAALLHMLILGATGSGKKGTALGGIRRLVSVTYPQFEQRIKRSGLSSGEGLVKDVRDRDPGDPDADSAMDDKRRLYIEAEYGSVMARARREGSSLTHDLRLAWDGSDLQTSTVNPMRATRPHIALVGQITPTEFKQRISEAEMGGGSYNRLLPVFSRRTKGLPLASGAAQDTINHYGNLLAKALEAAEDVGPMFFDREARDVYASDMYPAMIADDDRDGPLAEFVARAPAQVCRVAMVYTLLDWERTVDLKHLQAAYAFVRYARETAAYVLGETSNQRLEKLLHALREAGRQGLTRRQITSRVFSNHLPAGELDELLEQASARPDVTETRKQTGGRPVAIYTHNPEVTDRDY